MKTESKLRKYWGLVTISMILAIFLLALTSNVSVYQLGSAMQSENVQSLLGLPIPYKILETGRGVVHFDFACLFLNIMISATGIFFLLYLLDKQFKTSRV